LFSEDILERAPSVTAGLFLLEDNKAITGHDSGLVIQWNLENGDHSVLFDFPTPVRAMAYSEEKKIVVGWESGQLIAFNLADPGAFELIQPAKFDKFSRVWRTIWPHKDYLLTTSTYGQIKVYRQRRDIWTFESVSSIHNHSVFGLASSNGEFFVTGDYRGNVAIWKCVDGEYEIVQRLGVQENVQDIAWYKDDSFVLITAYGKIKLFERESQELLKWNDVFNLDIATSGGVCIDISDDGNSIYAATKNELIQFDRDTQLADITNINGIKKICSYMNKVYLIKDNGIYYFTRKPVEVKLDLIKYKFIKVCLLGHTQTGKSTFCNNLTHEDIDTLQSTFGKRILNYIVTVEDGIEKRLVFHDHGGQEAVLETFIPFVQDANIILIFFKQIDIKTYYIAKDILNDLKEHLTDYSKIIFVQTFIDNDLNEIPEEEINKLVEEGIIDNYVKISPKYNTNVDDLLSILLNTVDEKDFRTMILSSYSENVYLTLKHLIDIGYPEITYKAFKNRYQEINKVSISDRHLKFLLSDFTNQGIIEWYPEIYPNIIFNSENYNRLRSNIPIYIQHKKGIVTLKELLDHFDFPDYIKIIDKVYRNSKIFIVNKDKRIYPLKLSSETIELPELYKNQLEKVNSNEIKLPYQTIRIGRLIEALSEINLQCINVTKNEGLFTWEDDAFIYYIFQEAGDVILGKHIVCRFYISGSNPKVQNRLLNSFIDIVKGLYGLIDYEKMDKFKKKDTFEYLVCLSYASEQKDYVERVAELLMDKGIKVYYDKYYKPYLWGKNLPIELQDIYEKRSMYCIIFISKEYVKKIWTRHEFRSALIRELRDEKEYILPVRFNDTKLPGLDLGKVYLRAQEHTPEDIVEIFLKKINFK